MYLGLDLGTSGVRALLMDGEQRTVGVAQAALGISRPRPGWSEQLPGDWTDAAGAALDALAAAHPGEMSAVRGIGLSGQMHGATLIDGGDRALRPCILWNDTRSHIEAAELDADPRFRSISGNIVFPGFTAPKLVWVRRHEPEVFERTATVLLPKDYLRLWLTGDRVSEMSDAAGTSWLDTGARRWSPDLLAVSGMRDDQVPRLVEGSAPSGDLRAALADRWKIAGPVVVAGGAGDNAASAIGTGTIRAGSAFVSLGTSGVLFAANDRYRPDPASAIHAFCHALPDTWHQMGVILSAASALDWFSRITGIAAGKLLEEAGDRLRPPAALTFLPYLSGERTPHNDPAVRGAFLGLDHAHDRAALTRAILEGVAFALRDSLEALQSTGTTVERVTAVGGGARSRLWLACIATVLGVPVDVPEDGEIGAAFGAARLGMIAATGAAPGRVCLPPDMVETIDPVAALRDPFDDAYRRYHALYPTMPRDGPLRPS